MVMQSIETAVLSPHEREIAALVLREYADVMDKEASESPWPRGAFASSVPVAVASIRTREMRDIAHKLEWGD